jgi:predicted dinucleotide-binding enzyme
MTMTVAVIGTGAIGGALGRAFASAGLDVVFGSRDPAVSGTVADGTAARVATVAEALSGADTVVLAQPGSAVDAFLTAYGPALDGVLLVDAANRFDGRVTHSADQVADHAPGARYARAFNALGVEVLEQPRFDGVPADLFFSTGLAADRPAVETLISAVGLRPAYVGPEKYDLLDALMVLWVSLALEQGRGRHLAFRVMTD